MTDRQLLIKVCGMRDASNIAAVAALGVDMIGMIFYAKSPRYVGQDPTLVGSLPPRVQRVGVFVNESVAVVAATAKAFALDYVQLHGDESADYIARLRGECSAKVIKALSIREASDIHQAVAYCSIADLLLFDTYGSERGGNGTQFDWSVLATYTGPTPFLLSGGIGADDAAAVLAVDHERLAGIDLNSRFETAPAYKDTALLASFINTIRTSKQSQYE